MKITYLGILVVVIVGIVLGNFLTKGMECLFSKDDFPLVEQGFQLSVDGAVDKEMLAEFTASVKSLEASLNRLSDQTWDRTELGEETEDGGKERIPLKPESQRGLKEAIEKLTLAIESGRGTGGGVGNIVDTKGAPETVEMLPNWQSAKEAEKALMFLTARQVLQLLGRPTSITTGTTGGLHWFYSRPGWNRRLFFAFSNGYVFTVGYSRK